MIRKLLATTALTALMATSAFAQSAPVSPDAGTSIFNRQNGAVATDSNNGYFEANTNQILASNLLGETIYTGAGDDAEAIGDVNDVVMSSDGMAEAVIVGVGGFLGMGEKEVAVDFSRLTWTTNKDTRRLTMSATADELKSAPAFDRSAITGAINGMTGTPGMSSDANMKTDSSIKSDSSMTNDMAKSPREGMSVVDKTSLSAEKLIGTRVYGSNDSDLGEIGDVILSTDNKIEAYIVDVGGFLGLGEKPVALDASKLEIMQDANGNMSIYTPYTEEQLKNQPKYSEQAYKDNRDLVLVH